jgi:hypothetical protein
MRDLLAGMKVLATLFVLALLAPFAPANAGEYTWANRPQVVFPGPKGGIVHVSPYPAGARAAGLRPVLERMHVEVQLAHGSLPRRHGRGRLPAAARRLRPRLPALLPHARRAMARIDRFRLVAAPPARRTPTHPASGSTTAGPTRQLRNMP